MTATFENNLYHQILIALDGSAHSSRAQEAALSIARHAGKARVIGCHAYAARLHRTRFEDMEPGLPEEYRSDGSLLQLRQAHEGLISEGMQLVSDAYLDPLARGSAEQEVEFKGIAPEGRNYVEILNAARDHHADLTILGSCGQGGEDQLGSTSERVLLYSKGGDVLIMRRQWSFRPIVVGVDGSEDSYLALRKAAELALAFDAELKAVSVYDPFFHSAVFRSLARSLSGRSGDRFDISGQEELHNQIIDQGLESLYRAGLDQGIDRIRPLGVNVRPKVLAGKVSPEIRRYALDNDAGLIVVGRWGLHREMQSLIGSNALSLARLAGTNVLVVAPGLCSADGHAPADQPEVPAVSWSPEAEMMLDRIPSIARKMARNAAERYAAEHGMAQVTPQIMRDLASHLGM
ncbi:MAG TPA: universal stress protein [Methanotrichaceae archaeon]|nr:universal stress protein [Methanotrichaceae archaeon]